MADCAKALQQQDANAEGQTTQALVAEQAAATAVLDLLKEVQKDMVESAAKAIKERDAAVAAYAELSKKHEALREQVAKAAAQEDLAQARAARSQAAVVEALH